MKVTRKRVFALGIYVGFCSGVVASAYLTKRLPPMVLTATPEQLQTIATNLDQIAFWSNTPRGVIHLRALV